MGLENIADFMTVSVGALVLLIVFCIGAYAWQN